MIQKMNSRFDKCPKCKCTETVTNYYLGQCHGPIIVEEIIKCKKCGNIKSAWEYGLTYIDNWKDVTIPPLRYRIKNRIKKLFKKKDNFDDLPF